MKSRSVNATKTTVKSRSVNATKTTVKSRSATKKSRSDTTGESIREI